MDKESLKEKLQGLRDNAMEQLDKSGLADKLQQGKDKAMGELEKRGLLAKIREKRKLVVVGGVAVFLLMVSTCVGLSADTMEDAEGNRYRTVKIGDQVWMAENLNVPTEDGSWCYDDKPENCKKYGRLYTRGTALYVCPSGWHLPSEEELESLATLGGAQLKSTSGWDENGSDDYGFSALPAGHYFYIFKESEKFSNLGDGAYFWSSTKDPDGKVSFLDIRGDHAVISSGLEHYALSVRCLQD